MRAPRELAAALLLACSVALAPALLSASAPPPAAADTSNFTFDSFDAEYTLSRAADGTARLEVVETIVARFPDFDQNRGIIRAIADDYDGVPLATVIESVTDADGAPVYYETYPDGEFIELALGTDEFVRGVQTYVIAYSQRNVVRSFADTASDEFYWDVNGTGWGQPFGRVSATVTIDASASASLTGNAACYVGSFGDDTRCPIERQGEVFTASATDLAPGETLTVAIGFTAGTFVTPEPVRPPELPWWIHLLSGGVGVASMGALGASIISRIRAGRGARSTAPIIAQYTEPEGIDILQSAQLLGRSSSAIPAAVVRLAVRRNLRILAYAVENTSAPYTLQYLSDDRADVLDLALLEAIFGVDRTPGELTPYGKYDSGLASRLQALSTRALTSLVAEGFKRTPPGRGVGALLVVAQWMLFFAGVAVIIVSDAFFADVSWLIALSMPAVFFNGFIAAAFAVRPLQLTEKGRAATDHLEGMKLYLSVAEAERLRVLQSPQGAERIDVGDERQVVKLYERLLPWAVIWGIEALWMRELQLHVEATGETPDWFVGRSGFEIATFSTAVRGMATTLSAPVSTSSWSGSSGGSFSGGSFGGGFSGGGGGGGGGGGR